MDKFYRMVISNVKENYYFLCGGILSEISEQAMKDDEKRGDGISVNAALLRYFSEENPQMPMDLSAPNWLRVRLYESGET